MNQQKKNKQTKKHNFDLMRHIKYLSYQMYLNIILKILFDY